MREATSFADRPIEAIAPSPTSLAMIWPRNAASIAASDSESPPAI
jgi:hypothetical protein